MLLRGLKIAFFFVLFLLTSFYVLSVTYPRVLSPLEHYGSFQGIDSDRWMRDQSEIRLQGLFDRGNYLDLHFSKWHPDNAPAPQVDIFVCGKLASKVTVAPGAVERVFLKGHCQPRVVRFDFLNPIPSAEKSGRMLGAQLSHVEIASKYSRPLPGIQAVVKLAVILLLVFLPLILVSNKYISVAVMALALVSSELLRQAYPQQLDNLIVIGWSVFFLNTGVAIACLRERYYSRETYLRLFPEKTFYFYCLAMLVVALAAALRFYNLDFGFPYNYHPDEVPKYNAISRMLAYGDLNPRYFLHPTLLLYSTYFFNFLLHAFNDLNCSFNSTIVYAGRMMSATAGVASVLLTIFIGRRLFNAYTGLFAGAMLAVFPLHVTCSRYVKEDVLLTFMILLAVYTVIVAVQSKRPAVLLLAGLFAGFSAGVKYSGLMSVMILVGAPFLVTNSLKPDARYLKWTLRAILIMPLGFLLVTPYALLDLGTFLKDFNAERSHMMRGHSASITANSQLWVYHLSRSLWNGMQALPLAAALTGLGFILYRFRIYGLYIIALFLLYYLPAEMVKAKPAPQPERYIVPCLPFLAILACACLSYLKIFATKKRNSFFLILVACLICVQPLVRSINLAKDLRPDTRDTMQSWIRENIPAGKRILIDWRPYGPQFFDQTYDIQFIPRSNILENLYDENLKKLDGDYLVLSSLYYDRYFSQPNVPKLHSRIIRNVFDKYKMLYEVQAKSGTYGFHNPKLHLFKLKD